MSKGLDALEEIKQAEYFVDFELNAKIKDEYKTELTIIEKELKALATLKDLIGNIEIEQYNKKPNRYELRMCGKTYYINEDEYQALKEVLL